MDSISFENVARQRTSKIRAAAHQEASALETLRTVWRRRRLVVGTALLGAVVAATVTILRPARYPSEALVELGLSRPDPSTSMSARSPAGSVVTEAASIVLGEARIIRSRMVMRRVIERLGLVEDPNFSGENFVDRAMDQLLDILGQKTKKTEVERRFANAERNLMSGLSVQTDNRSYLIMISYASTRPDVSARIVNTVGEEYLASRVEANVVVAGNTADWLTNQIATAQKELQFTEAEVAALRAQTGLIELGPQNESLQQLQIRELNRQLGEASALRVAEAGRLARIEALAKDGSAAVAAELQSLPLVQAAIQRVTDAERTAADMQFRFEPNGLLVGRAQTAVANAKVALKEQVDRGIASLRARLVTLQITEQDLRARVQAAINTLIGDSVKVAQLRSLQSTATSLQERLQSLTRNRDQALALWNLRVVPASLIVRAQPSERPEGLNPILIGLLGLIGGGVAGVAFASLLERADHGLRTSNDVTSATSLRCLGMVPELPPNDPLLKDISRPAISDAQVVFDEAVRLVTSGAGLLGPDHSDLSNRGRVVVITEAVPGDGGATLCAGLARSLSLTGQRVLVIDGRPGRFSQERSAEIIATPHGNPHQPVAQKTITGMVHHKFVDDLSLEVFGSVRLRSALEEARSNFDVILVAGPPVMLVADALVLGQMGDTVIHAVHWAKTKRQTVQTAVRRLEDHGVIVNGIVLMHVDVIKHGKLNLADQSSYHLQRHEYYLSHRINKPIPASETPPRKGGQAMTMDERFR